ncbi:MAG: hypothetical protein GX442_24045 [Candidatus Riflebacteria bacterium]|nr:hypothetical protein [Candidatus Riflebacteria bacterium]
MSLSRGFSALTVLLVILLPCAGLARLFSESHREAQDRGRAEQAAELERIVSHLARLTQPRSFYQQWAGRLVRSLQWGGEVADLLASQTPEVARVFLFDGAGKRVAYPGLPTDLKRVSERCFQLIRRMARHPGSSVTPQEARLIEGFLGRSDSLEDVVGSPGTLVALGGVGNLQLAGVFPFRDRHRRPLFLLVVVDLQKVRRHELAAGALRKIQALAGPRFSFGFLDLEDDTHPLLSSPETPLEPFAQGLAEQPGQRPFVRAGRLFASQLLDRRFRVFGTCPEPEIPPGFAAIPGNWLLISLTAGLLLALGQWVLRRFLVPIRFQVVFLFGLAAFLSLGTLLGFARGYREATEYALVQDQVTQARTILDHLDSRFGMFLGQRAALYQGILRRVAHPRDLPRLSRALEPFRRFQNTLSVFLVDASGTLHFHHLPAVPGVLTRLVGPGLLHVVSRGAAFALQKFHEEFFPADLGAPGAGEMMNLEEELAKDVGRQFFRIRGRLDLFRLEKAKVFTFVAFACTPAGRAFAALVLTHERNSLERGFLRQCLRDWHGMLDRMGARVLVLPKGEATRAKPLSPVPRWETDLFRLHDRVDSTQSLQYQVGAYRRCAQIMTGLPGRNLEDYHLFFLTPLEPVLTRSQALADRFLVMARLLFLFAVILGWVFTNLLMGPLRALSHAIACLRASRFSEKVGIPTGDILEEIGKAVTSIFDDMRQLAYAQDIQASLLPAGPLAAVDCWCHGWTRSASEIGGEMYDHLELPDGRVAFALVAVPGNRLSSAFLLSMVKMAIHLLAGRSSPGPGAVLADIRDRLLRRTGDDSGVMILLGCYERPSGRLAVAVQGTFLMLEFPGGGRLPLPMEPGLAGSGDLERTLPPGGSFLCGTGLDVAPGADRDAEERRQAWLAVAGLLAQAPDGGPDPFARLDPRLFPPPPSGSQTLLVLVRRPLP